MFTHRNAVQNVRLRDYYDRYPIIEAEAVQLGRGALSQRSVTVWGRNCILVRSAIRQKATSTIVAHPDWVMLQCPISWQGDLRINGHVVRAGDVFLLDGGKEWFTSGERRDQILLGVKRKALSAAVTSQRAGEISDLELKTRLLVNGSEVSAALRRTLTSLLATVGGMVEDNGRLSMPPVHEADLISAIAACLDTSMDTAKPSEHQRSSVRTLAAMRSALREAWSHLSIRRRSLQAGRRRAHADAQVFHRGLWNLDGAVHQEASSDFGERSASRSAWCPKDG